MPRAVLFPHLWDRLPPGVAATVLAGLGRLPHPYRGFDDWRDSCRRAGNKIALGIV